MPRGHAGSCPSFSTYSISDFRIFSFFVCIFFCRIGRIAFGRFGRPGRILFGGFVHFNGLHFEGFVHFDGLHFEGFVRFGGLGFACSSRCVVPTRRIRCGAYAQQKTRRPEGRRESKSVSRVLYWMIIYLGAAVTGRLERSTLHRNARRAAASKVHMILHRIGFTWPHNRLCAGELLPRLSTLTRVCGRYLSVALSLGSPPPDVIRYPALWCTDFPRAEARDHLIYFFPSIRKKRLCRKRTGAFGLGL